MAQWINGFTQQEELSPNSQHLCKKSGMSLPVTPGLQGRGKEGKILVDPERLLASSVRDCLIAIRWCVLEDTRQPALAHRGRDILHILMYARHSPLTYPHTNVKTSLTWNRGIQLYLTLMDTPHAHTHLHTTMHKLKGIPDDMDHRNPHIYCTLTCTHTQTHKRSLTGTLGIHTSHLHVHTPSPHTQTHCTQVHTAHKDIPDSGVWEFTLIPQMYLDFGTSQYFKENKKVN